MIYVKSSKDVPYKFHENFHTSESCENCYIEVEGHDEHEYGINFMITIISNTISPLPV